MPSAESEAWFEAYLKQEGLSGGESPEPDLGVGTRPDYLVTNGVESAVCEVKEFDTSGMQKRLLVPHNSTMSLSSDEVYGDIRRKIREAARQLKPLAAADVPLVVVLANPNRIVMGFDVAHVQAAASGNPTFGGPYDPTTGTITSIGPVRGRDGKLTNDHQYLSAIVLLHRRTHAADFDDASFAEHGSVVRQAGGTTAEQIQALVRLAPAKPDAPPGFYFWVEVMHTVSAVDGTATRLGPTLFNGPRDRGYAPDSNGFYAPLDSTP